MREYYYSSCKMLLSDYFSALPHQFVYRRSFLIGTSISSTQITFNYEKRKSGICLIHPN